jgi:hypothetical protein
MPSRMAKELNGNLPRGIAAMGVAEVEVDTVDRLDILGVLERRDMMLDMR